MDHELAKLFHCRRCGHRQWNDSLFPLGDVHIIVTVELRFSYTYFSARTTIVNRPNLCRYLFLFELERKVNRRDVQHKETIQPEPARPQLHIALLDQDAEPSEQKKILAKWTNQDTCTEWDDEAVHDKLREHASLLSISLWTPTSHRNCTND